jgi:hypothetical protein
MLKKIKERKCFDRKLLCLSCAKKIEKKIEKKKATSKNYRGEKKKIVIKLF